MIYRTGFPLHASALVASVLLAGCAAVGPDYHAPTLSEKEVPNRWTSPTNTASSGAAAERDRPAPVQWWTDLDDEVLNRLVREAFASSPTLEAATARLSQSRAQMVKTKAAGAPSADASLGAERAATDSTRTPYNESWSSVNASWEIDLFGAVRRGNEGAVARQEAQLATLEDARVTLAADVTDAYLGFRTCMSNLSLSAQDVASREETERLTAASVQEGFTAPYKGIRSTASVAEAKTRQAETKAQCEQLENLLTRLTGVARPVLDETLAVKPNGLDRLPVPRHFSIDVPGRALTQRPDIRAAEREVAAASADIGLAEADRYPRLALNGTLGYSATATSGSGALSFGTWSFGPSLSLPILDGGRRAAAVEIAKSKYDESLAHFKAKARGAIQEIEDALTRYAAAHERAENARVAATQYQQFFDVVEHRYREGANNLLELEDARRSALSAQQTLLAVQQERLQAWVALYRTTGGAAQYAGDASSASAGDVQNVPAVHE